MWREICVHVPEVIQVIPQVPSTLLSEAASPTGLQAAKEARLARQQALAIHLSLPPQGLDYKSKLPEPSFFLCGFWRSNLGPCVCKAYMTELLSPPKDCFQCSEKTT